MFILDDTQPSHYEWQIPTEAKPHFILHFDLNKTLIASDRESQKTAHDVVCAEIADQVIDLWEDSFSTPISYGDYVKNHLLPNPNNSKEIKLKQKVELSKVLTFLRERNHPAYSKMQEIYDRSMRVLEKQETQIFPSFYKLIEYLQREGIRYTLVIRTFGSEAPEITEELNQHFGKDFITDFRDLKEGNLEGIDSDLYELVATSDHHLVIRDDWAWWSQHGQHWQYGKPFPIDVNDSKHVSLFFDDNAKMNPLSPQENIVFPYDASSGDPISPDELVKCERLVPVDMLEALSNENYYIQFVQKALGGS